MNTDAIIAAVIKDVTKDLIHTALEKDIDYGKLYDSFRTMLREQAENNTKNAGELADERKKIEMLKQLNELFENGAIDEKEYELMKQAVMISETDYEKTIVCEFCGFKYPYTLGACPKCNGINDPGADLEKAGLCPKCGKKRNPSKSICTACGYKFRK